jgi:hypothetical protein
VAEAFLFALLLSIVAPGQTETINNQRVIELVAAGIGDSVLIPKIRTSRVIMDASQAGLLKLKAAGVSDDAVVAMMERAAANGFMSNTYGDDRVELPAGTEITIETVEKVSGRKVTEGQVLIFRTAEDVIVGGQTLISKNAPVLAVVSKAKSPGMAGRSGQLSVMLESTTSTDGQTIKLRAAKNGRGGDNFGTAFTLSYIMGIGLLIPGKNAEIKAGTVFTAFTDETNFISVAK